MYIWIRGMTYEGAVGVAKKESGEMRSRVFDGITLGGYQKMWH